MKSTLRTRVCPNGEPVELQPLLRTADNHLLLLSLLDLRRLAAHLTRTRERTVNLACDQKDAL